MRASTENIALALALVSIFGLYYYSVEKSTSTEFSSSVQRRGGKNYATTEGTERFAARFLASNFRVASFGDELQSLKISTIGMGTYIGDVDDITDRLVIAAIKDSIAAGINHIDSASNYRKGRAEAAVGAALATLLKEGSVRRDELIISSKAGFFTEKQLAQTAIGYGARDSDFDNTRRHCVSPACLKASIEQSLRRLRLEIIDVLYLHNVAEKRGKDLDAQALKKLFEFAFLYLEEERKKGRIRFYGLATFSASFRLPPGSPGSLQLSDLIAIAQSAATKFNQPHGFRFVQLPVGPDAPEMFARAWQNNRRTLADVAQEQGIVLVSSKSLGFRQKKRGTEKCSIDDSAYRSISNNPGALRLHLTRSAPGLTTALVGHKQPDHVRANLAILQYRPLSSEQFFSALSACPNAQLDKV